MDLESDLLSEIIREVEDELEENLKLYAEAFQPPYYDMDNIISISVKIAACRRLLDALQYEDDDDDNDDDDVDGHDDLLRFDLLP